MVENTGFGVKTRLGLGEGTGYPDRSSLKVALAFDQVGIVQS
jgi:hypothetical protein